MVRRSATTQDIDGWFAALHELIKKVNSDEITTEEEEAVVDMGLTIIKSVVTDINRIADALDELVMRGRQ